MGTEVLIPKDCLVERIRDSPCRRPNFPSPRSYRKKREPSISKRPIFSDDVPKISRNHHQRSVSASALTSTSGHRLVMEKVTILRRGESVDSKIGRFDPEKETGADLRSPVAGKVDVYAGSAFAVSPSPSALPLPSFSKKQISVDDSASRDLRRLLRLDF